MDYFGLRFYTSVGIINHNPPYGTELVFTARETTGGILVTQPYTNDIYKTEGGYSASLPRKNPWTFTIEIQILNARTLDKLDIIHDMVADGNRANFNIKNGYLLANASQNTLFNFATGFDCTIDVGELVPRDIRQAGGNVWKKSVQLIIRESLALTRPTAGDIVIAPGGGGGG